MCKFCLCFVCICAHARTCAFPCVRAPETSNSVRQRRPPHKTVLCVLFASMCVLVHVNECVRVHVDSGTSSSDETLINVQRLIISFPLQMHMAGPLSCARCQGFPHGRKAFYWTRATLGAQNNAAIATVRGSDFGGKEREEGIGEGGGGWGKRRG